MNLKYKIIEVHPETHSIVVRYYTDLVTEAVLASQVTADGVIIRCRTDQGIELPVPAPTGAALEAFITARAPRALLEMQETLLNNPVDTSLDTLTDLIGVEVTPAELPTLPDTIPVVVLPDTTTVVPK